MMLYYSFAKNFNFYLFVIQFFIREVHDLNEFQECAEVLVDYIETLLDESAAKVGYVMARMSR